MAQFSELRHLHLLNRLRPQSSANHIHNITPIAQRDRQHFAEVGKHQRVGTDLRAERDVFQQLGHGADAVVGGFEEDIKRGFGVDQQGSGGAVDAGDGHVSIHEL